jgi:hypothetical protein
MDDQGPSEESIRRSPIVGVIVFFGRHGYLGNYLYWRKYQRVPGKVDDGGRDPAGRRDRATPR